jgi:L-cystine uptake protein TcyP (sodium:dicarboxylate symporter family)
VQKANSLHALPQGNGVLLMLINWIITVTPFAVLSLIASAVEDSQRILSTSFANVGYLVLASCFGMGMQFLVVYVIYYLVTKTNPFTYLKKMFRPKPWPSPASSATIPMTLKSVRSTGVVPESGPQVCCSFGSDHQHGWKRHLLSLRCIWLAVLNGIEPNVAHYLLVINR